MTLYTACQWTIKIISDHERFKFICALHSVQWVFTPAQLLKMFYEWPLFRQLSSTVLYEVSLAILLLHIAIQLAQWFTSLAVTNVALTWSSALAHESVLWSPCETPQFSSQSFVPSPNKIKQNMSNLHQLLAYIKYWNLRCPTLHSLIALP